MEWTKSLQHLPTFTIKEIELFFGDSGKTGKTTKRVDNLLFENFLDSISCSHDTNYFYVKAICSASYTKNVYHQLSCCFSRTNAQVEYAYCTCKAGRGGFCNHVYALFKLTAQFVLDKLDEVPMQLSCTSRPCGWTVPKVRKMNIQKPTVMETVIKKPKLGKNTGVKCNLYEARSPDQQIFDTKAVFELQENLKEKNPKIPLVTGLHSSISSDEWCNTKFGKVPIFCPLAYQCSKLGNHFNVYHNIDIESQTNVTSTNISYPDFPHQTIPQYYHHDISTLSSTQKSVLDKIQITNEQAATLEQATQSQSQDRQWFEERRLRVTASRIHDVFQWKRGMERHGERFASDNSDRKVPDILQKKFDHGKMYEPVALEKYKLCMNDIINTDVYPCGLVINENNCWLGSSPDAKVLSGNEFGIVECKCPEQHKHSDVFDVASSNKNFMLFVVNGKLQLRKTHPNYYQVQCQLALTGAKFCDFVVYTFQSIGIVRITFDAQFWANVIHVVGPRYFKYILPNLQ